MPKCMPVCALLRVNDQRRDRLRWSILSFDPHVCLGRPQQSILATIDMFDPLSATFGEEPQPPWPTTPRTPNTPIPNLPRPSSRPSSRPQTPDKGGLYGRQPQIYGQPDPGLISPTTTTGSNGTKYEKAEPYLKVRIAGLDRNRRDILVKFDAQVSA